MRKVYIVPNIITAFGLACGLFVIYKAMFPVDKTIYALLHSSALILLLAGFADLLDGALARVFHAESEFGFMFDSLADSISFGVAPTVLFLRSIHVQSNTILGFFTIGACMIYSICAVLRLVRFNVKSNESKKNRHAELMFKKTFIGFPVPASAAVAVSTNLFFTSPISQEYISVDPVTRTIIMSCTFILLGYFMISRWKFPTVKTVRIRIPGIYLVFLSAILAIFILFGVMYFLSVVFVVFSLGYLVFGILLSIYRRFFSKRTDDSLDEIDSRHEEDHE